MATAASSTSRSPTEPTSSPGATSPASPGPKVLARVDKLVPYNVEQQVKDRGAIYHKAKIPFVPRVITDGRLITGQNPASAKDTAQAVAAALSR